MKNKSFVNNLNERINGPKITKGPWMVMTGDRELLAGNEFDFSPINGCGCCGSPWIDGEDNGIHNARLIAAAPDLYDAAMLMRGAVNKYMVEEARKALDKALAKARGET